MRGDVVDGDHRGMPQLCKHLRFADEALLALLGIRAVYRMHLTAVENVSRPGEAVRVFRDELLPRYNALFTTRAGLNSVEALKSLMLLAVASDPPLLSLRDDLLAAPDVSQADRSFIEALAALVPGTPREEAGDRLELAAKAALESNIRQLAAER